MEKKDYYQEIFQLNKPVIMSQCCRSAECTCGMKAAVQCHLDSGKDVVVKLLSPSGWTDAVRVFRAGEKVGTDLRDGAIPIEEGLFVDNEGTMYINGYLNPKIVKMIEKNLRFGRRIVFWTGGDPNDFCRNLIRAGIDPDRFKVARKSDYKGKIVDEAVDDEAPFMGKISGVKVLTLHRV